MMYNYWFTADQPPVQVQSTLGIFKPGGASSVDFMIQGPRTPDPVCRGDIAPDGGDGTVGVTDLLEVINSWGPCAAPCPADMAPPPSGDGTVGVPDLLAVINEWGPCK
jgi:hypothetical protein